MVFKLWGLEPSGQNPFGLEFKPSFPLKPTVVLEFPAGIFPSEFPGNVTAFLGNPVGCRRSEEIPEFQWINWIYCWWQEGRRSPQDSPVRAVEGTDVPFVFWCPFCFSECPGRGGKTFPEFLCPGLSSDICRFKWCFLRDIWNIPLQTAVENIPRSC